MKLVNIKYSGLVVSEWVVRFVEQDISLQFYIGRDFEK